MMDEPSYLTTRQAAELCGVSAKTVGRWVDAGILPAVFTAGGHRRLPKEDLDRFLASRRSLMAHAGVRTELRVVVLSSDRLVGIACRTAASVSGPVEIVEATGELEAGIRIGELRPQVVLVDSRSRSFDALRTCRAIASAAPQAPYVAAIVAFDAPPDRVAAFELLAQRVLRSPLTPADVSSVLHDAGALR